MIKPISSQQKRYCRCQYIWYIQLLRYPPQIFTYGTASEPQLPSNDLSAEIVTHQVNPTPRNNPINPVPNVTADPDSGPSLLYSSESSDNEYYKRRRRAKIIIINAVVKRLLMTLSKSAQSLHPSYLQLRTNQISSISYWMGIHYIARFIYYLSLIYFKLFYHDLVKHTCCLCSPLMDGQHISNMYVSLNRDKTI